ncbi:hypothetical protein AB5I41_02695 [Sphingomonas sp. MMS24-JH45]
MEITGLDHIQLAIPAGGEDAARVFYAALLGLTQVEKPAALAVVAAAGSRAERSGCTSASTAISVQHERRIRRFSSATSPRWSPGSRLPNRDDHR